MKSPLVLLVIAACGSAAPPAPLQQRAQPPPEPPVLHAAPGSEAAAPVAPSPSSSSSSSTSASALPPIDLQPPALQPRGQVTVTTSDECGMMFDTVYFTERSVTLRPASIQVIDATAQMLVCLDQHGEHLRLLITGHTDAREPDPLGLSDQRAQAVVAALVSRGVPAERLTPQGEGASVPRDARNTARARARNRRVEFVVTSRDP
ncbi:MAG TPA: OmpA family protein [Kofleriaceae bacterium]|nr:OmpA family protein [Kofleriaceae bacterium]